MASVITSKPHCNRKDKPLPRLAPVPELPAPETDDEPWDDDDVVVPMPPTKTLYRTNRGMQFPRSLPALTVLIKRRNVIQRVIEFEDPRNEWIRQFNQRPGRLGGTHAVAAFPGRDYAAVAPTEPMVVELADNGAEEGGAA